MSKSSFSTLDKVVKKQTRTENPNVTISIRKYPYDDGIKVAIAFRDKAASAVTECKFLKVYIDEEHNELCFRPSIKTIGYKISSIHPTSNRCEITLIAKSDSEISSDYYKHIAGDYMLNVSTGDSESWCIKPIYHEEVSVSESNDIQLPLEDYEEDEIADLKDISDITDGEVEMCDVDLFSELPSAFGSFGSYGTNHLNNAEDIAFVRGMENVYTKVLNFSENELEKSFGYYGPTEKAIKTEIGKEILENLIAYLIGDISDNIISLCDNEVTESEES